LRDRFLGDILGDDEFCCFCCIRQLFLVFVSSHDQVDGENLEKHQDLRGNDEDDKCLREIHMYAFNVDKRILKKISSNYTPPFLIVGINSRGNIPSSPWAQS